jgi:arylsulfatase A-like enzyme
VKNAILLTIDTLRKDAVGCYGGGNLTPSIDSIQDHCLKFNMAHSPGPYTKAAFPGMLTSKNLWDTYAAFMIPHCMLYENGYRSLGAKTTTVKNSDIPAREQDLANTEERMGRRQDKEKTVDRLRKLGYI